ncbi:MAG: transketolase C-terminal domain-containing protein, partial [Candidatus Micrarchaeota archaeon]
GGPSTGLPTRTEQGDLKFAINASQGEFPKAVIAPGDVHECFELAGEAFNIAEMFQTPVILLTDKFLAESFESVEKFDESKIRIERGLVLKEGEIPPHEGEFKRYALTESGVSPRTLPGTKGGIFRAQSYEHNEEGHFDETQENRIAMHEKRMRKVHSLASYFPQPELTGEKNADVTFVSWGSPKGSVLDCMDVLKKRSVKANFLQLKFLWPFPSKTVKEILSKAKNPVLVENNRTAQLGDLIAEQTGIMIKNRILRFDARPFTPDFILDKLGELNETKKEKKRKRA